MTRENYCGNLLWQSSPTLFVRCLSRVMRHRTRARRGGGIPPTKYRAADGGCSAREESRFSPKRETNACAVSPVPEDALRGHGRGRSRYPPERSGVAERDALAGVRNPFRRGGLHRTRPRSRICIRRAGRRTGKAPASKGEHGCPDRDRTLESKPAQHRKANTHADNALNQRQKKSLVRLRSSSCEATVWTEAGMDLRNTAP